MERHIARALLTILKPQEAKSLAEKWWNTPEFAEAAEICREIIAKLLPPGATHPDSTDGR